MQQLLYQTERTGPAANEAPEGSAENPHGPDNIKTEKILAVFQGYADAGHQLLQTAYGTVSC